MLYGDAARQFAITVQIASDNLKKRLYTPICNFACHVSQNRLIQFWPAKSKMKLIADQRVLDFYTKNDFVTKPKPATASNYW